MNGANLITRREAVVKAEIEAYLRQRPMVEVASLNAMQALAQTLIKGLARATFQGWNKTVEAVAKELGQPCPRCGSQRKCMKITE